MGRAEELRALADRVEQLDGLAATYTAAQDAHRGAPDDPDARAAYRAAAQALDEARTAIRAAENRQGLTVGGDMTRSET